MSRQNVLEHYSSDDQPINADYPLDVSLNETIVNVHIKDLHEKLVNEHLIKTSGVSDTLDVAGTVDDITITVTNGAQFSANDRITLTEGLIKETATLKIISIATDVLTIDKPLENAYTTAAAVNVVTKNLNVDGSSTSLIYEIGPPTGVVWHIYRLIFTMVHTAAATDALFGGITALSKGVVIRHNVASPQNLTVWRNNGDFIEDVYDLNYSDRAGGGTLYGTSGRWTFKKSEVSLMLDGTLGETLQAIVQDDLTGLSDYEIKIQGHIDG